MKGSMTYLFSSFFGEFFLLTKDSALYLYFFEKCPKSEVQLFYIVNIHKLDRLTRWYKRLHCIILYIYSYGRLERCVITQHKHKIHNTIPYAFTFHIVFHINVIILPSKSCSYVEGAVDSSSPAMQ